MKFTKKLIGAALAVTMLSGAVAGMSGISASADSKNGIFYQFSSYYRRYDWGEYPDKATYSSNGYVTLESEKYAKQHQVMYETADFANEMKAMVKSSLAKDDPLKVGIEVLVEKSRHANNSDETEDGNTDDTPVMSLEIQVEFCEDGKTWDDYDDDNEPDVENITKERKIPVAKLKDGSKDFIQVDFGVVQEYLEDGYSDFRISKCGIHAMNYSGTINKVTGQVGVGEMKVVCSPIVVVDDDSNKTKYVPEFGTDLGEDFDPSQFEWDPESGTDGPFKDEPYGGHDIIRTTKVRKFIRGDVNGDEKIDGKDISLMRKKDANWDVTIDEQAADCDGDGRFTGKDIMLLRKYIAEWDVTLAD